MIGVNSTISAISVSYNKFILTLPSWGQIFVNLFLIILVILLYLFFVRGFYRSITKKDIFGLNLNQYNKTSAPFIYLLYKGFLYMIEYIIVVPFVVFFWFSILSFFLFILTNISSTDIFLVAAIIVVTTRVMAYYKKEMSENVAKLLPFNLLAMALLTPNFFNFTSIIDHFSGISSFFGKIVIYLIFIIAFEMIMRAFDFIISLFDLSFSNTTVQEKKAQEEEDAANGSNSAAPPQIPEEGDENSGG